MKVNRRKEVKHTANSKVCTLLYSFEGLKKTFKDIVKFLPCSVRNFALACGTIVSVAKAAPKQ